MHRARHAPVALAIALAWIGGPSVPPVQAQPQTRAQAAPEQPRTDFDGDGLADLVVGGSDQTGDEVIPSTRVLYGSRHGPSPERSQTLDPSMLAPPRPPTPAGEDVTEHALAPSEPQQAGDFDGDGFDDLVTVRAARWIGRNEGAGAATTIPGSPTGLDPSRRSVITIPRLGASSRVDEGEGVGRLAAADFGRGPEDDLVIGMPGDDAGGNDQGAVYVVYGSPRGLDRSTLQVWRQETPGIEGRAGDEDKFGELLVSGHFAGSRYADLAIGNPSDHYQERWEHGAGTVVVLYGSAAGLTATGSQRLSSRMPELRGRAHVFGFPMEMAAGDFDADGADELVVSSGEGELNQSDGAVMVIPGSPGGLRSSRMTTWSQDSTGLADRAEAREWFGGTLTVGQFGKDPAGHRYADLAIGVSESFGDIEAGAVHIVFGGPEGLTGSGSQFWSQASRGVAGSAEGGDEFGFLMVAGDVGDAPSAGRGFDDLVVNALGDTVDGTDLTGAVTILYGSPDGLLATGRPQWTPLDFGYRRDRMASIAAS